MKKVFTLLFFICFGLVSLQAQQRYLDEVFTDVTVTSDVEYGVNATVLFLPSAGEALPQSLTCDIYEPVGDTETERPLVLVFHTGNFLPNVTNGQISGTKTDSAVVEICTQLARRGFVAAATTYRQGWNPLAETQPERALGLIQAAYRGIQDGRTAIRFFKKTAAEDGNPYGIDTERITCWGNGTGGYITLGLATLDDYAEIINTTNSPGKFLLDTDGDMVPETPMVVPPYHGDIEGKVLTVVPADGFGFMAGDTTNYPNHVDYSSDYQLTVNIGGALGDVSWIDENSTPIITVQSATDQFAPYEDAVLIVPTTGDPIVQVQGGLEIHMAQNAVGNHDIFDVPELAELEQTMVAMDNSATAGHDYMEALYPYTEPANSFGQDEGVAIDWWDPNAPAPGQGMGIPWNLLPHPTGVGSFHEAGLLTNEGMSAEKARGNIANVMAYVIPRACIALDLGCNLTSTEDVVLDASMLTIAPNPAFGQFNIEVNEGSLSKVELYGMDGKLYISEAANGRQKTVYADQLPTGVYIVKAYVEEGIITQRVRLN